MSIAKASRAEKKPLKLLDRVATMLRTLHDSIRIEEAYVG